MVSMTFSIVVMASLCATVSSICPMGCYCKEGFVACSLIMEFPMNLDADTTKIRIEQTNIGAIPSNAFSYLPNLLEVEFVQGNIREIAGCAFMNMPSIDTIKFEKTNIGRINSYAFSGLDNVTNIVFANTKLSYIEPFAFFRLNNVITFNVLYSTLDYLSAGSFYELKGLSVVYFSNNNISDILTGAFSDVSTENFHMMTNTIWNMDCGVLDGMNKSSTTAFEFIGNTFYCNCSVDWLLNNDGQSLYKPFMVNNKCHGPNELKAKNSLSDVQFGELGCKRQTADKSLECQSEVLVPKPRCIDPSRPDGALDALDDSTDTDNGANSFSSGSLATWLALASVFLLKYCILDM